MAGHGGGAWKVAYADFVTAMMAFFMVMWLTSQKPQMKESVAQYFRDPFSVSSLDPPSQGYGSEDRPSKKGGRFSKDNKQAKGGNGPPGRTKNGFAPVQFDDLPMISVLFPVDSDKLTAEQLSHLKKAMADLLGKRNRIEIRAHSLRKPLPQGSPYGDHWELCFARARAVKQILEGLGVSSDIIRMSQAEGNEPIAASLDQNELELNSRVDVFVLPEVVKSQRMSSEGIH